MKNNSPTTWFISDTHFFHNNIIGYANRPFKNVEEMNKTLIANWNKYIKPEDTVIHLGDFSMLGKRKHLGPLVEQLNGKKILIKGNHDGSEREMRKLGFTVFRTATMMIGGQLVLLSHYPYKVNKIRLWWIKFKTALGLQKIPYKHDKRRPIDQGLFLLHGHTHSSERFRGRQINLCVEAWDYKPVNIQEIANYVTRKR